MTISIPFTVDQLEPWIKRAVYVIYLDFKVIVLHWSPSTSLLTSC